MRQFIISGYRLSITPRYEEISRLGDDLSISDHPRNLELDVICRDEKQAIGRVKEYFAEVGRI